MLDLKNKETTFNVVDACKNYHHFILGVFFILLALLNLLIKVIPIDYTGFILLAGFTSASAHKDIRRDVPPKTFFKVTIPFIIFVAIILINGNGLWHRVLRWEMGRNVIFNWNSLFSHIPFNDGGFARIFHPAWLTTYMKMVYNTGFVLALLVPLVRALVSIDFKKMLRYSLSAHIFQVFIITPFYITFYLQEVWYVRGHADMLERHMNHALTMETTLNCFPSMHTSIAFAMFLLVLRERNKIFKWVWGIYCISVIYSTMYLEIHWVIDVIGGLLLGYITVKLVDFVILKGQNYINTHFKKIYSDDSISIPYEK